MQKKTSKKNEREQTVIVTVSMSADLARAMGAMAEKAELSVSAFVRQLILKAK
jgi:hypothetical protein